MPLVPTFAFATPPFPSFADPRLHGSRHAARPSGTSAGAGISGAASARITPGIPRISARVLSRPLPPGSDRARARASYGPRTSWARRTPGTPRRNPAIGPVFLSVSMSRYASIGLLPASRGGSGLHLHHRLGSTILASPAFCQPLPCYGGWHVLLSAHARENDGPQGAEEAADAGRANRGGDPPVHRSGVPRHHHRGHRWRGGGLPPDVLPLLRLEGGRGDRVLRRHGRGAARHARRPASGGGTLHRRPPRPRGADRAVHVRARTRPGG